MVKDMGIRMLPPLLSHSGYTPKIFEDRYQTSRNTYKNPWFGKCIYFLNMAILGCLWANLGGYPTINMS